MRRIFRFITDRSGSAAAELALVIPIMLTLMFGSLELGNLFLDQHALSKQVRDGARFASRLQISDDYDCPDEIYQEADAETEIINVTKTGAVSGTGSPRWTAYWDRTCAGLAPVSVTFRCVAKADIDTDATGNTGIYTALPGTDIPVVKVSGAVRYRSVLAPIGFDATNICLRAESEVAMAGS